MYGPGGPVGLPGAPAPMVGGRGGRFQRKPANNNANNRPPLADLPPNLIGMFEASAAIEFKPPVRSSGRGIDAPVYSGLAQYLQYFDPKGTKNPPRPDFETPLERKMRLKDQMLQLQKEKNELLAAEWDPHNNTKATENAYATLFVARLSYDTTEKKLRREFEQYGALKTVRIVKDMEGKSRGYAFVEFEREEDMTTAYKRSDGKKIDNRRILVDVERGRTVRNWKPMRVGGGLGGRKEGKSKKQQIEEAVRAAAENERSSRSYRDGGGQRDYGVREPTQYRDRNDREGGHNRDRDRGGGYRDNRGDNRERERDRNYRGGRERGGESGRRGNRSRSRDRWERGADVDDRRDRGFRGGRDERGDRRDGDGRRGMGAEIPPPMSVYGGGRDSGYNRR